MREQELRIALVCFGGVSLAVYMHGISKEILKLVRASCALHAIADRQARMSAQFFDRFDPHDPEFDTEAVYFELLREIGRKLELRVIVDIIAGASAGGINATILARAISHDLPIGKLRDLWLDSAAVSVILAAQARAGPQQMDPQAVPMGGGPEWLAGARSGSRGSRQAIAVRALAVVQTATRRRANVGTHLRRHHRHGSPARAGRLPAADDPAA